LAWGSLGEPEVRSVSAQERKRSAAGLAARTMVCDHSRIPLQITYRKLIQWVSTAVGLFISIFTIKYGDYPNFATQNIKRTTISCGVLVCLKIENTISCNLLSLNNRNSLYY